MEIAEVPGSAVAEAQKQQKASVSVIVTAFNEEDGLRDTVLSTLEAAAAAENTDIEILIVNDGSSDGTAAVADALAKEFHLVRCIHHDTNRGFGEAFRTGLDAAKLDYVTFIPGDNLISISTLRELLRHVGQADLVCVFPVNTECRSRARRLISSLYSFIYRQTYNLDLRAIHTTPAYRVRMLHATPLRSRRYSLASEIMVKLLRQGCTFMELPGYLNPSQNKSSALQVKNAIEVVQSYLLLFLEVYVRDRNRYSRTAVRVIPEELRN